LEKTSESDPTGTKISNCPKGMRPQEVGLGDQGGLVRGLLDHLRARVEIRGDQQAHVFAQSELVSLATFGQGADEGIVPPGGLGGQNAALVSDGLHLEADIALVISPEDRDEADDVGVAAGLGQGIGVRCLLRGQNLQDLSVREAIPVDGSAHGLHGDAYGAHRGWLRLEVDGDDAAPHVVRGQGFGRLDLLLSLGNLYPRGLGLQGMCCGRAPESGDGEEKSKQNDAKQLGPHDTLLGKMDLRNTIGIQQKLMPTLTR
jgi:hypothetical protein